MNDERLGEWHRDSRANEDSLPNDPNGNSLGTREEGLGQVTTRLNVNWKVDEKLCCCVQIEDVRSWFTEQK